MCVYFFPQVITAHVRTGYVHPLEELWISQEQSLCSVPVDGVVSRCLIDSDSQPAAGTELISLLDQAS